MPPFLIMTYPDIVAPETSSPDSRASRLAVEGRPPLSEARANPKRELVRGRPRLTEAFVRRLLPCLLDPASPPVRSPSSLSAVHDLYDLYDHGPRAVPVTLRCGEETRSRDGFDDYIELREKDRSGTRDSPLVEGFCTMAKTRSSTGNTPRKGASVSGSGTPAKATSTATDLAAAAAAGINGGGMTSRRTASTDSDSSSGASSSNSPSDGGSFFSRTSHSTAGTSPTPSIMAPRKGWSSAQAEVIPRPSHVDPSAPLSPEPLSSDALASRLPDKAFDLDPDFVPHPEDPYCLRHAEFGYDENERYRWTSGQGTGTEAWKQDEQIEPPYYTYLTTYLSYLLLILIGYVVLASR